MADFHIETLEGGISQLVIEGTAKEDELELLQMVSQASKKFNHLLVNLLNLRDWGPKLFLLFQEVSARTNIKAISSEQKAVAECNKAGIAVFPTIKSASLSYAGDETLNLLLRKLKDIPILNTEAYRSRRFSVSSPA